MIIEDESIIAKDIECILKNYGYKIAGPYSRAEDAINVLDNIHPHLILMDVVLKGEIDGIDAARIIKEKISVPIIFLTAYADDLTISRIKNSEPYGYFLKPFEEKELFSWIETTLHKFKKEEELKKNEKWLKSILIGYDKAIIALDEKGSIKLFNRESQMLTGYNDDEITGTYLGDVIKISSENINDKTSLIDFLNGAKEQTFKNNKSYIISKDNIRIPISYSISPIIQDKIVTGCYIILNKRQNKNEAENIIKELNNKLEDSKREIKQLAYVSSHDLQEPLRMVASYVQLLQKRYQGKIDSDADEFISFAVEGVNRMKALLNDLLIYSRLNTVPPVFSPIDCNVLAQQAINLIKIDFPGKVFEVNYNLLPVINADSSQIRQLFMHILSNAVKFNDKEIPVVDISYKSGENFHEFKISDNGIGMDSEYYSKIFEVFHRLHNYNEYPGTGIGLAICKKIAENHNGCIRVESTTGKGSTFYIKISYYG